MPFCTCACIYQREQASVCDKHLLVRERFPTSVRERIPTTNPSRWCVRVFSMTRPTSRTTTTRTTVSYSSLRVPGYGLSCSIAPSNIRWQAPMASWGQGLQGRTTPWHAWTQWPPTSGSLQVPPSTIPSNWALSGRSKHLRHSKCRPVGV